MTRIYRVDRLGGLEWSQEKPANSKVDLKISLEWIICIYGSQISCQAKVAVKHLVGGKQAKTWQHFCRARSAKYWENLGGVSCGVQCCGVQWAV